MLRRNFLVDFEAEHLCDTGGLERAVSHGNGDFLVDVQMAVGDFSNAEAAKIRRIVQRGYENLQRAVGIACRSGNVADDAVAERRHIDMRVFQIVDGEIFAGGGIDDREVEQVVRSAEFDEKVEDLIDGPVGTGGRLVDFIDDDDNREG